MKKEKHPYRTNDGSGFSQKQREIKEGAASFRRRIAETQKKVMARRNSNQ